MEYMAGGIILLRIYHQRDVHGDVMGCKRNHRSAVFAATGSSDGAL